MKWTFFVLHHWLGRIGRQYRCYCRHGVFLPNGADVLNPESVSIGSNFTIGPYSQLICQDPEHGSELRIGHRVALNCSVHINADQGGKIHIGNDVIIGPMTTIRAANHRFDDPCRPIREQGHRAGRIIIEDDVWIAANVVVLADVTIGRSSVVGAGSVVTRDIPAFSIAAGNPARIIRSRLAPTADDRFDG